MLRRSLTHLSTLPNPPSLRWHSSPSINLPPNNNHLHPPTTTTTPPHHDLPTFLAHARATSLSPTTTLYIGTHYEYLCQHALRRLSFTLARTGGRSDRGIDLIGHWHPPSLPGPLRALVQCKALGAKATPNMVRELEGMLAGAPEAWREGGGTVVVLCSTKGATVGVREAVREARVPVLWVGVEGAGWVRQLFWNERVVGLGVEGVGRVVRYVPGGEGGGLEKEVVLTWKGEVWEPGGGRG